MGDVNALLSRLDGVRRNGDDRWIARCPSHDDKNPSLTIRECTDGRILVHCFAGCGAVDVIQSLGLAMTDLFPERLGEFKPVRGPFSSWDALQALKTESAVIAIAASDCAEGKMNSQQTADRVALAAGRIATALEYIHGSP